MRVGVDGWRLQGLQTGVGRYLSSVLRHWGREVVPRAIEAITLYTPRPVDRERIPLPANVQARVLPPHCPMLVWQNLRLALSAREDVLFCPSFSRPLLVAGKSVVAIHEAMLPQYPHLYPLAARVFYRRLYAWSARRAALVIAGCEAARRDVARYYGVPVARVRAISMAPAEVFRPLSGDPRVGAARSRYLGSEGPFFLFVGKLAVRDRNVPALLSAFAELKRRTSLPHRLLVIGLESRSRLSPLIERLGISDHVRCEEYVPDEDLNLLFNGAEALVFPSAIETFSLPVLEAQATGTPVICVGTLGLRETTGGAALLLSSAEPGEMVEAMWRISSDAALRRELSERGLASVRRFSWKRCAIETLAVLAEAGGLASPSSPG